MAQACGPFVARRRSRLVTDLTITDLELDEQWSFAGSKKAAFADSAERGEAWWHKAMARESRLLVEQFVAARTQRPLNYLSMRALIFSPEDAGPASQVTVTTPTHSL